jgi:hypothetical protein
MLTYILGGAMKHARRTMFVTRAAIESVAIGTWYMKHGNKNASVKTMLKEIGRYDEWFNTKVYGD